MRSGCEIVLNEGNPSVGSFHNPTATDSTPTTLIMTPEGNVTVSNSRSENPQGNSGDDDYRGEDSEVESDDETEEEEESEEEESNEEAKETDDEEESEDDEEGDGDGDDTRKLRE